MDLVRLETGLAYQARVHHRLRDEGCIKTDDQAHLNGKTVFILDEYSPYSPRCRRSLRLQEIPLKGTTSSDAQSDSDSLLLATRTATEEYLDKPIKNLTVTIPSFVTPAVRKISKLHLPTSSYQPMSPHATTSKTQSEQPQPLFDLSKESGPKTQHYQNASLVLSPSKKS